MKREGGLWSGLAVTYSPASWDAVPSAAVRLTAEFGMGSGVSRSLWPPDRIRVPHIALAQGQGDANIRWFQVACTVGLCMLPDSVGEGSFPSLDRIKPIGRLVPVN